MDLLHGKMYWGQSGGGTDLLQRANLDGSNVETLLVGVSPNDVALHIRTGKIYWVDGNHLWRADLDGAHEEIIIENLDWPLGLDIDLLGGTIYVTDAGTHTIQTTDLHGASIKDILTVRLNYLMGIALDVKNNNMYWVEWGFGGTIQRANLDGTEEEILVDDVLGPWYIDVAIEADVDGDGVAISEDACPETTQEGAASHGLGVHRYADIDNDNTFETKLPSGEIVDSAFDMSNTKGCSCSQILDSLPGNHEGERKFGCTKQTLLGSKNLP